MHAFQLYRGSIRAGHALVLECTDRPPPVSTDARPDNRLSNPALVSPAPNPNPDPIPGEAPPGGAFSSSASSRAMLPPLGGAVLPASCISVRGTSTLAWCCVTPRVLRAATPTARQGEACLSTSVPLPCWARSRLTPCLWLFEAPRRVSGTRPLRTKGSSRYVSERLSFWGKFFGLLLRAAWLRCNPSHRLAAGLTIRDFDTVWSCLSLSYGSI